MNYEAVYRTALATSGLLKKWTSCALNICPLCYNFNDNEDIHTKGEWAGGPVKFNFHTYLITAQAPRAGFGLSQSDKQRRCRLGSCA